MKRLRQRMASDYRPGGVIRFDFPEDTGMGATPQRLRGKSGTAPLPRPFSSVRSGGSWPAALLPAGCWSRWATPMASAGVHLYAELVAQGLGDLDLAAVRTAVANLAHH